MPHSTFSAGSASSARSSATVRLAVAAASVDQARLAASARAAPDAAAGLSAAAILWTAWSQGIPPATAAGALAALALLVQPLRLLADVRDRRQAWRIAHTTLERALSRPTLESTGRRRAKMRPDAPALVLGRARFRESAPLTASLAPGEIAVLRGRMGVGKTALLMAAAGLERPTSGCVWVFGQPPRAVPRSIVGYVGPAAPILRGSLRRNAVLGVGQRPDDAKSARRCALPASAISWSGWAGLAVVSVRRGAISLAASAAGCCSCARCCRRPRLLLIDAADARLDRGDARPALSRELTSSVRQLSSPRRTIACADQAALSGAWAPTARKAARDRITSKCRNSLAAVCSIAPNAAR